MKVYIIYPRHDETAPWIEMSTRYVHLQMPDSRYQIYAEAIAFSL